MNDKYIEIDKHLPLTSHNTNILTNIKINESPKEYEDTLSVNSKMDSDFDINDNDNNIYKQSLKYKNDVN